MSKYLYRYISRDNPSTISLELLRYRVKKETPCGYWYVSEHFPDILCDKKERRWVSKDARARKCYPTPEEAFKSFQHRAKWRLRHAERGLMQAKIGLKLTPQNKTEAKPNEFHWEFI